MSTTASPREVFERLLAGITSGAWSELPSLYAADAVVELPFAAPGQTRLEGREAIRKHFEQASRAPLAMEARIRTVHATSDPEVIVAEFDYDMHVVPEGQPFTVSNVQVLRVRDGLIQSTRDYHDHAAIARGFAASKA